MTVKDLSKKEYLNFQLTYLKKAGNNELMESLIANKEKIKSFFESIPEDKFLYKYAKDKWTIKELLQHIIDTERIFSYRALRIARNDKTELPGFDQDEFNPFSGANNKSKYDLIADYSISRDNTISLFKSFSKEMLLRIGHVSTYNISPRAIGFVTVGHENHHVEIIKERYL
ncbi:DinB family protein [Urechidicola croceus]|uniref:Damage-inducible protein DinB n=1 Tax=Urechidicola croceus TaxID=1850246 RepID=A0A1D8PAK3_9FLAO|nr:DinB family protein [Urechidicola croceus]AOW21561.1 damage-inducible protein DinB [Urechidicola croceus]